MLRTFVFQAINCVFLVLSLCRPAPAADGAAIGDSLAIGFGEASHLEIHAVIGISSCRAVSLAPATHYRFVLLSAGTNDPPGRCLEALREKVDADRVEWVVPVNRARWRVIAVAEAHHDKLLFYTPDKRAWPHPASYFNVRRD